MARSSRLSVCLAIVMRNSSKIHCARSISRQRTTPWTAGIGPLSIIRAIAWRWASLSLEGWPGALPFRRPSGPRALNRRHPVADDLKTDAADLRRLSARRTVVDRSKRQKPPGLRAILRLLRQAAEPRRVKILPQSDRTRHGEPPSFATLNQNSRDLGIAKESRFQGLGISPLSREQHQQNDDADRHS